MVITDPRAPSRPADLLEADGSPRGSRRLVLGVLGVVGVLVATQAVSQVRERRATDAEERRLRAVVELEPVVRFEAGLSEEYQPAGDRARLSYAVGVRNTGPRDVRVVDGVLGDLELEEEVDVPVGEERRIVLVRDLECATRPGDGASAESARLSVRSEDGSVRPVELPTSVGAFLGTAPARACRYLDPGESLFVEPVLTEPGDGFLDARFALLTFSRIPVRVTGVSAGAGMLAELLDDEGRPLPLPLTVPANDPDGVGAPRFVTVRLRVGDCARVPARSEDPFAEPAADITFTTLGDGADTFVSGFQASDPAAVRRLVDRVC